MAENSLTHKTPALAPLKIIAGTLGLVNRLQTRGPYLPGIGVLSGFSGYGKTFASNYVANKTRAVRVEVGDTWTRRTLLLAILREAGVHEPRGSLSDLMGQAIRLLGENDQRPLIIDEADKLADKGSLELVRELHEFAQVPVLLIGEEGLPGKMARVERVHNRVLEWQLAMPCDFEDARKLAAFYLRGASITDGMLERVRSVGEGRARRIATSLSNMAEWAVNNNCTSIDGDYPGEIFNGHSPQRRAVNEALRQGRAAA